MNPWSFTQILFLWGLCLMVKQWWTHKDDWKKRRWTDRRARRYGELFKTKLIVQFLMDREQGWWDTMQERKRQSQLEVEREEREFLLGADPKTKTETQAITGA